MLNLLLVKEQFDKFEGRVALMHVGTSIQPSSTGRLLQRTQVHRCLQVKRREKIIKTLDDAGHSTSDSMGERTTTRPTPFRILLCLLYVVSTSNILYTYTSSHHRLYSCRHRDTSRGLLL